MPLPAPGFIVEVTTDMDEATVRAVIAVKTWRWHKKNQLPATVQVLAQQGVATSDRAIAKRAIAKMCEEDDAPLRWYNKSIELVDVVEQDRAELKGFVRSYALRHGMEKGALPWDLK